MHIRTCSAAIVKDHLSRYKNLKNYKSAKKSVITDHLYNIISPIKHLWNNYSEVIDNIIYHNSGSRSLSNLTATPVTSQTRKNA